MASTNDEFASLRLVIRRMSENVFCCGSVRDAMFWSALIPPVGSNAPSFRLIF
jgi:hypothetical protein